FDDYSGRGKPAHDQQMSIAKDLTDDDLKLTPPKGLNPEQLEAFTKAYQKENDLFQGTKFTKEGLIKWKYQRYVKDYLRCIDAVDDNVGRVLDYLDKSGLAENTVVIYTSDQGFFLGEHGWFDKRWMYEESFRTPLIVKWPGVTNKRSLSNQMVMNLDFAETILDMARVKIPADMQGKSFAPVLKGQQKGSFRDAVYYHFYE